MMGEKMKNKSFAKLVKQAKKREAYWLADAVYTFTEELHNLAENANISRSELARRLGVSPAYITKLFRGNANFTIETMVRLARAVGARLHLHIAPEEKEVCWLYAPPVLRRKEFPGAKADQYESISTPKIMEGKYEPVALAA
ncbi:MAG: helix-turn-helix transcriptional regulator [Syntrophales bacterium]|nr:helix-turn-helix transcriptional regulator [Syntrophales bacterium]MDD5643719.1 helix-turn-helix transcriptional regulator [Syntrophales bacterium]